VNPGCSRSTRRNDDRRADIDPAVSRAIEAAQARGVRVTLATGRTFGATRPFARRLHIHDPLICYQGAMVCDPLTAEIYEHEVTPGHLAAEAVDLLRDRDIFVFAYIDERLWPSAGRSSMYLTWHPKVSTWWSSRPGWLVVAQPPTAAVRRPAGGRAETSGWPAIRRQPSVVRRTRCSASRPRWASAGAALSGRRAWRSCASRCAIGDHENDLPMIAGRAGLAIGNAIQACARWRRILPPVEQAGGGAIERYILSGGQLLA
jgi:hypothetical protein